jgi:hypothetical protein
MNAEALAQGFTLTLESGVTVEATAGETTQQLADKINLGTGTETSGDLAPESHNGHGYTAAVSGDVITLTAVGAITGGAGADGAPSGNSVAVGDGDLSDVSISMTPKTQVGEVTLTAGMTTAEMHDAIGSMVNALTPSSSNAVYGINPSTGSVVSLENSNGVI